MPGYDGTGPEGRGPLGRRMGPCGGGDSPGRRNFFGFGYGRRGGWRRMGPDARYFPDRFFVDKNDLQAEKSWLEQRLEALNRQIDQNNKA